MLKSELGARPAVRATSSLAVETRALETATGSSRTISQAEQEWRRPFENAEIDAGIMISQGSPVWSASCEFGVRCPSASVGDMCRFRSIVFDTQ